MAFWGVEVTPTRRYLHRFDPSLGRLHISQATLGNGSSPNKSIVQCNVGDKAPVLLCCLMPEKTESCSLNLEFEEEGVDVIFSVVGPRSVHLAGYYLSSSSSSRGAAASADGDETDSYGEDIAATDTDDCSNDTDYDYEDDFIDDSEHIQTYPSSSSPSPSPNPKSRAVIENGNANPPRKRLKKKYQVSDSDADNHKPIILGGTTSIFDSDSDSDDQDSLPISSLSNSKVIGAKRKSQHSPERGIEVSNESSLPFSEVGKEISEKRKKKKKKEHTKEGKTPGVVDGSMNDVHVEDKAQNQVAQMDDITLVEPVSDERRSHDKEVEKVNKSCPMSSAEHGPKKKGKKKRANEGKTQAGGTDNVHIDDKAQMQEAQPVGVTNDDHGSDAVAVAVAGGKKKKKKHKKKAGDEPASVEEPRKEIDKGGIEGRNKHK